MVKSTACSSRGPRFNSQHPHDGTQLSVTPDPGDLTPFLAFTGSACTQCTDIYIGNNIDTYENEGEFFFKEMTLNLAICSHIKCTYMLLPWFHPPPPLYIHIP